MHAENNATVTRLCACGCDTPIDHKKANAKYADESHRTRASSRRNYRPNLLQRPFVALDGEGIQDRYVLLACGNGDFIQRRNGLGTEDCLSFLVHLPRGSNAGVKPIYIWFAFDYDVNMILGDLPREKLIQLRETNEVWWHGYHIRYIQRKILRVRYGRHLHTSYDTWGFFASSFEKALADWKIPIPDEIVEGKAARGNFGRWSLGKIRTYNEHELYLLQQLAEKLREAVQPLDLPIQSWHGPAALAAAWLRKQKTKRWLPTHELETEMEDACVRAYFGGRIDVAGYGHCHPVYHYDIVSAYPSAIRNLPDLSQITWEKGAPGIRPPRGSTFLARIRWGIPTGNWGPLPWRSKNGTIFYPLEGEGWYWNTEIEAALEKYGESNFEFVESFVAKGVLEFPFRNLIEELFQYRAELKRGGSASNVAVKLILNSLYGKFAQTVGAHTYFSPIWAGLITAQTRSQLSTAITDSTVCVMTDSIWSLKPLDLPLGQGLGMWEKQDESELWLAGAGLYTANTENGDATVWQRGFDKTNPVDIAGLVNRWLYQDDTYEATYQVHRFVGMGLALQTKAPWRTWIDVERRIQPLSVVGTTKRTPIYPLDDDSSYQFGTSNFVSLVPRARDSDDISYPYSKLTLDPDRQSVLERLQDECDV